MASFGGKSTEELLEEQEALSEVRRMEEAESYLEVAAITADDLREHIREIADDPINVELGINEGVLSSIVEGFDKIDEGIESTTKESYLNICKAADEEVLAKMKVVEEKAAEIKQDYNKLPDEMKSADISEILASYQEQIINLKNRQLEIHKAKEKIFTAPEKAKVFIDPTIAEEDVSNRIKTVEVEKAVERSTQSFKLLKRMCLPFKEFRAMHSLRQNHIQVERCARIVAIDEIELEKIEKKIDKLQNQSKLTVRKQALKSLITGEETPTKKQIEKLSKRKDELEKEIEKYEGIKKEAFKTYDKGIDAMNKYREEIGMKKRHEHIDMDKIYNAAHTIAKAEYSFERKADRAIQKAKVNRKEERDLFSGR